MYTPNKLLKTEIYRKNNIYPYEGINMWEDNGLMYRMFYHSDKVSYANGHYYHYRRNNTNSITHGYGKSAVMQMICCAKNLSDFFQSKPDGEEYKETVRFIQYLAKINLITDSYSGIKEYRNTFPEVKSLPQNFDKSSFSTKGLIRYYFVENHLSWLFVSLFKILSFVMYKRR